MARRINPAPSAETDEKEAMPGGAPGIPEEPPAPPPAVRVAERDPEELARLPAPKLYRVEATRQVLYGGVPTVLRAGKTLSEATHDLTSLRAQGVVLVEVPHAR